MRRYETTFITTADLSEEELDKVLQKALGPIQSQGQLFQVQDWGKKRLAYTIRKQSRGHYTFLDYAASPSAVKELERLLRLDDSVLRFLTVMVDEEVDVEAVKAGLSQARPGGDSLEEETAAEGFPEEQPAQSEGSPEA
ncbi:MAG: 30S ribosomal protein S6 [bacterium]